MSQTVPFDALLGAAKTGLAIGATIYELDGSTSYAAFSTTGWYEAPGGSGGWHHAGLSLPDAGGVVAVGISGTEYIRIAVEAAKLLASSYTAPPTVAQIDTQLSNTHGAGAWATATGFATPTNVSDAQTAITDAIPTPTEIDTELSNNHGAGSWVDTGAGATAAQVWSYATRTLTDLGSAAGVEFTYTVTDSTTTDPIADVSVWFSTNIGITNVIWYGSTDAFGIARDANGNKPRLDAGVYFVLCRKTGFSFTVDLETVS
jgi:hypothetical protein